MRIGEITSSAGHWKDGQFQDFKIFFLQIEKKSTNLLILTIPKISNLENAKFGKFQKLPM